MNHMPNQTIKQIGAEEVVRVGLFRKSVLVLVSIYVSNFIQLISLDHSQVT